jgi:two-component system repressor protein LuxO
LLAGFNKDIGKEFTQFSESAADLLLNYQWPGNVRELQNVIENMVIMHSGTEILPEMLPDVIRQGAGKPGTDGDWIERRKNNLTMADRRKQDSAVSSDTAVPPLHLASESQIEPLWLTEKQVIEEAIRICRGNVPQAAARLGVSPSTLYRKMKSWDQAS